MLAGLDLCIHCYAVRRAEMSSTQCFLTGASGDCSSRCNGLQRALCPEVKAMSDFVRIIPPVWCRRLGRGEEKRGGEGSPDKLP